MTLNLRLTGAALAALLIAPLAAACGGDGDGSDEEYVTAFCETQREFTTTLEAAIRDASTTSDFDAIAEPFETLAGNFKDMDPPEDMKDWHEDATDQLSATAERVKEERNLQAVTSLPQDPLKGMPDGPRARLQRAAANDPACDGLNVFRG